MHAEDASQVFHRLALPVTATAIGLEIAIGLGDAEIEKGAFHGADVEHRAQRRPPDAVIFVAIILIEQIA